MSTRFSRSLMLPAGRKWAMMCNLMFNLLFWVWIGQRNLLKQFRQIAFFSFLNLCSKNNSVLTGSAKTTRDRSRTGFFSWSIWWGFQICKHFFCRYKSFGVMRFQTCAQPYSRNGQNVYSILKITNASSWTKMGYDV